MNQYVRNQFTLQYKTTVGADFLTKTIQKKDASISLQLWDTAGQERYNSISTGFYRNAETCVLVFDLTVPETFEKVDTWRKAFLQSLNPPEGEKFPFVLLGNKSDMKEQIKVNDDDIREYCIENNDMPYFSVSAKSGENVQEAFSKIADLAYERNTVNDEVILPEIKPLQIQPSEPEKKRCCK